VNRGEPDSAIVTALGDLAKRVRLGANPATPCAILAELAADPAVTVRASVALNAAAPSTADHRLAKDPDERIRLLLAQKMLAALPEMPVAEQERLGAQTVDVLFMLVQDEAVRIRTLVAEMLSALPGVPRGLILALAHDMAVPVSEPVLRLSPLLTATDLLALLHDPPHDSARCAIAGRSNLPSAAADVIAASADSDAIRALLANPSAAIRESTLDSLIARAQDQPSWHEPLVRRPSLPPRAARALSEIVASQWLQVLTERTDLPPALQSDLKQLLWARMAGELPQDSMVGDDAMMQAALLLESEGKLDEASLLDAVQAGDVRRVTAMLAVAAGVTLEVVDRAASLRSAKALVSLVWRAGFSMQIAVPIQSLLGRVGPAGILTESKPGFPLGTEEMGWQIDLLTRDSR
jgi:uncharacterized protein (DUF2336 family)